MPEEHGNDDKPLEITNETEQKTLFDLLSSGKPDIDAILSLCSTDNPDCQSLLRDGSTPLHVACKNAKILSHPKLILTLLEAYPLAISSPNEFGFLPLHKAVSIATVEHIPSLQILIDHYPEGLKSQTRDGQGVLHLAITGPRMPSPGIIEFLCQQEPLVACIPDAYGQLPLHKASAKPRIDIETMQVLFQSNPHALTLKDQKGMLPLHWVVCRGNLNIDVLLLVVEEYREGLLELDYHGRSPLMRYISNVDKNSDIETLLSELTEMTREDKVQLQRLKAKAKLAANEMNAPRTYRSRASRQSSSSRSLRGSPPRSVVGK